MDFDTRVISITLNVIFHETVFPFPKDFLVFAIFHQDLLSLHEPNSIFPTSFDILLESSNTLIYEDLTHDQTHVQIIPHNSSVPSNPNSPLPSIPSSSPLSSNDMSSS